MGKINEKQIRKNAIKLYLEGTSVNDVCSQLGRSREWFYKWLRRYKAGDSEWYQERSREQNTKEVRGASFEDPLTA